ncbi:MAG: HAMP domain-containing protein [Proteobacteria bacterium]|nr:HAMP domain-containing protein [Pseudomonadota bacterium]
MKLQDLRIGTRLGASFGLIVLLIAALSCLALQRMAVVQDKVRDITEGNNVQALLANDMLHALNRRGLALRDMLLYARKDQTAADTQRIADEARRYDELRDRLAALFAADPNVSADETELMKRIRAAEALSEPFLERSVQAYVSGHDPQAAKELLEQAGTDGWRKVLGDLVACEDESNREAAAAAADVYRHAQLAVVLIAGTAALLAVALGWLATRSITRPIQRAVALAENVAAGDLTTRIETPSQDETGRLLHALQRMQASLTGMVQTVRGNAENVAMASTQIAQGNLDLSSRTEEQASALEETSASMEQLGATVKSNAEHANQASALAASANTVAGIGGEVVGQVVATMKEIDAGAARIADIIGVIDGIAFQTNILALNAAVEAARAGEQGRGFAVVATEVRSLAGRCAVAAKDIKALIGASTERVGHGSSLVERAGGTMQEVIEAVRRVAAVAAQISDASVQQSAGVAQIGEAVVQMDQATQQNAALVEESAAAAESLRAQAQQLVQAVAVFRTA